METKKRGFTLVELSLALVFISILLLTIGYLTIHITSVYEKGLAIKSVNASAKEIIDDMSRAIGASPAQTVSSLCGKVYPANTKKTQYERCVADSARKIIYQQNYNIVEINGKKENVPVNGAFCTGRYSYIWNTAYALNSDPNDENSYHHAGTGNYEAMFTDKDGTIRDFRLLKVSDFDRQVCRNNMVANEYKYRSTGEYRLNTSTVQTREDMLEPTTSNLYAVSDIALYDFVLYHPSIHSVTSSGFYSASFILATLRGGININTAGEFCSDPPDNLDTDFAYCAINKFNFSMKAAGEKLKTERWN